jgi:carbon-monoxide dehydrogenase large subunit
MGDMSELQKREDALQGLGTSLLRKEDAKFIRGQGSYIDDIKLPGMLFGAIVRSPYAHARIKAIDKSKALACPGVVAGQPALDADPGRRRAGRAGRQEGLLPDAGSGHGAGHRPLRCR